MSQRFSENIFLSYSNNVDDHQIQKLYVDEGRVYRSIDKKLGSIRWPYRAGKTILNAIVFGFPL